MYLRESIRQTGFTILEAVAVLVLLGALSTVVLVRWSPGAALLNTQADLLANTLRHAQALALAQGRRLTFDVQSSGSYAITDGVSVLTDLQGISQRHTLSGGATVSGDDVNFDSLGRPVDSGGNLVGTPLVWTLGADGSTSSISMQPLTGFVAVTP
ncbi:MAG: type II secretion system protein [Thiogranum sp.]|jgi:type II secretory pathway pseudopilin PulG